MSAENAKPPLTGLHHVTAIASDPQRNLDFYAGVLGLRFVKRTVNFDDPGTYHFYYGDPDASPGSILTFFAWPGARRGSRGTGQIEATAFSIAPATVDFWIGRLEKNHVPAEKLGGRFGEEVIRFADPDGMQLELIARKAAPSSAFAPSGGIPVEAQLRGLHSVSASLEGYARTAKLLTDVFGYQLTAEVGNRFRFSLGDGLAQTLDLLCRPDTQAGHVAAGSVHHIAFRTPDDQAQLEWRARLVDLGYNVSPVMDRDYFHSIYFREPGGILFEIATDPPGFTLDEPAASLGEQLKLPKWLEPSRSRIQQLLPPIKVAQASSLQS